MSVNYCGATINGPKVARNVVLWSKTCRQRVKVQGEHCRFHRPGESVSVGEYDPRKRVSYTDLLREGDEEEAIRDQLEAFGIRATYPSGVFGRATAGQLQRLLDILKESTS